MTLPRPQGKEAAEAGFEPSSGSGKESIGNAGGHGFKPWVGKTPWRRKWQPTPVFLPGKSHGQRSREDYRPWGCKRVRHDLATTRQLAVSSPEPFSHPRCVHLWRIHFDIWQNYYNIVKFKNKIKFKKISCKRKNKYLRVSKAI